MKDISRWFFFLGRYTNGSTDSNNCDLFNIISLRIVGVIFISFEKSQVKRVLSLNII
jgi:hypothetical protein